MATKTELEARIKQLETELSRCVAKLESAHKAIDSRFIRQNGSKYIALPLTDEETNSVKEKLHDLANDRFDGYSGVISGSYDKGEACYQDVIANEDTRYGAILPQWDGYVVRYSYTTYDGVVIEKIWGMKIVK